MADQRHLEEGTEQETKNFKRVDAEDTLIKMKPKKADDIPNAYWGL